MQNSVALSQTTQEIHSNRQHSELFKPIHGAQKPENVALTHSRPSEINTDRSDSEEAISNDKVLDAQQAERQQTERTQKDQQAEQEIQVIRELSARDREVRAHEQAHAAVGGQYAGSPRYQYQRGPDGVNYAISGEVPISLSEISGDPRATIEKAQVVQRAAMAPAEPSPQDRKVAAMAAQMEARAMAELATMQQEQREEEINDSQPTQETTSSNDQSETTSSFGDESDTKTNNPFFNSQEEQMNASFQSDFNQMATALNRQLLNASIDAQAPRPGDLINSYA